MTLTAEFRLTSSHLSLDDVAAAVPELILQLVHGEQPKSGPFVIRATGSSFDGLEPALGHSSWVQDHFLISETEVMQLYQLVTTSRRPIAIE